MKIGLREDRCSGCLVCQTVCSLSLFKELNPKKSAVVVEPRFPTPGNYGLRACDQCGECAAACPVGCIEKGADGVYRIDDSSCTGCLVCVEACPQKVMRVHSSREVPIKCTLCGDCIRYCPRSAIYDVDGDIAEKRWY